MKKQIFFSLIIMTLSFSMVFPQAGENQVYIDNGILKWTDSQEEVALFGVNYTVPFAHAYRSIKKLGLSHKQAIDMDVSQMARLELEAYRIHVWDREVSDTLGNLIENKHLELLDYLIHKLKEKNIRIILTPIAWWGTGWPEPDPATPGFSSNYSKEELITIPAARTVQKNYVKQFLNHINKYTDLSYKTDPDIIAFEVINEPGHPADTAMVTDYINEMATLIRNEGVNKPVYYNISQNWSEDQAAAVYRAKIDGISFQWYPSGLVKNSELTGNYLANVDHYPIPEIDDPKFKNKTRMVYEFDAADIAQSVIYPAMARSFREAGMQWATMFSYDPTYLAAFNTEYNTHYVNLLYTPQKAISLMIAANVFRTVETYQKFPSYPENLEFAGFKISYKENLSELNDGEKFYYSNNTVSRPKNLKTLKHIAGYGSSALVKTKAKGAYFIDQLKYGLWRLELYPDMIDLMNPFGRNSLDKRVRVVNENPSEFKLSLPGLKQTFYVQSVLNDKKITSKDGNVSIKPGVYILSGNKSTETKNLKFGYRNLGLKEYPVPDNSKIDQEVIHRVPDYFFENQIWKPSFKIISDVPVDTAILYVKTPGWRGYRPIALNKSGKYIYQAEVSNMIRNGIIEYCLFVKTSAGEMSYPAKVAKNPGAWDYYPDKAWKLKIIPENSDIILFDPEKDFSNLIYPSIWEKVQSRSSVFWDKQSNAWIKLELTNFRKQLNDYTFRIELDKKADLINVEDYKYAEFKIDVQNTNVQNFKFQLINSQYEIVEIDVDVSTSKGIIQIPLNKFDVSEFVLLPRPYPHFLPYTFKAQKDVLDKDAKLNFVQISIPFKKKMEKDDKLILQFSSVRLVK